MSAKTYEEQLAAWKAKHGLTTSAGEDIDPEDMMAVDDAKRPGNCYCMGCAEEFPISAMRLITRRQDPYLQMEDDEPVESNRPDWYIKVENRVRMCAACFKEKYEDDEDDNHAPDIGTDLQPRHG